MENLPRKQSLVTQTAAVLKDEIRSGAWPRGLPSERKLCEQLAISRRTLRSALACLQGEGLIGARHGLRWEVLRPKPRRAVAATKLLVLLIPKPLYQFVNPFELYWIDSLREHLGRAGYELDVRHEPACYSEKPERALEELARRLRPAGWVLSISPEPVQRWFSERGLPCVIVGGRYPGIVLPNVDRDFPAACHHAAGQLIAKGHTHLTLLIHKNRSAGDLDCVRSFLNAAVRFGAANPQTLITHHNNTREDVCRQVRTLLRQRPAVTGFLIRNPTYIFTVLGTLQREGLRVPGDAALIAGDSFSILQYSVPSIARYTTDPVLFARKVSRTVLRLVQGEGRSRDVQVIPRFVPGETFG